MKKQFKTGQTVTWNTEEFDGTVTMKAIITEVYEDYCIIYWNIQPIEEEKEDDTKVVKQIPILRYYNVFHISQVDGVQPKEIPQLNKEIEPLEQAEKVKEDYKTSHYSYLYSKICFSPANVNSATKLFLLLFTSSGKGTAICSVVESNGESASHEYTISISSESE